MSAQALNLFPDERRAPRAPRYEVPIATPQGLKATRLVQALFTCAAPNPGSTTFGGVTAVQALERVLGDLGRTAAQVSVQANPETPHDVEIRDESDAGAPRHMLAMIFTGLNIAEARAALATLQASTPKPKGRRS